MLTISVSDTITVSETNDESSPDLLANTTDVVAITETVHVVVAVVATLTVTVTDAIAEAIALRRHSSARQHCKSV